jgi:hypothetical protein
MGGMRIIMWYSHLLGPQGRPQYRNHRQPFRHAKPRTTATHHPPQVRNRSILKGHRSGTTTITSSSEKQKFTLTSLMIEVQTLPSPLDDMWLLQRRNKYPYGMIPVRGDQTMSNSLSRTFLRSLFPHPVDLHFPSFLCSSCYSKTNHRSCQENQWHTYKFDCIETRSL